MNRKVINVVTGGNSNVNLELLNLDFQYMTPNEDETVFQITSDNFFNAIGMTIEDFYNKILMLKPIIAIKFANLSGSALYTSVSLSSAAYVDEESQKRINASFIYNGANITLSVLLKNNMEFVSAGVIFAAE